MPEQVSSRFAIYYTPAPEHPLTVAAKAWLGRDGFVGGSPTNRGFANPALGALTVEPRRYGFHATLKAPFRLKADSSVEELERALRRFAATWSHCPIGPLKIDQLGDFFALVPASPLPVLRRFASRIVEEFDHFRAPMSQADFQRRLQHPLDETETTHLMRWGYPYVFERFRFHMTLTDPVPVKGRVDVKMQLEAAFQPLLAEDFCVDALSLFVEAHPGADFVVRSQFPLRDPNTFKQAV